jgi:hypothetical protein
MGDIDGGSRRWLRRLERLLGEMPNGYAVLVTETGSVLLATRGEDGTVGAVVDSVRGEHRAYPYVDRDSVNL